MYNHAALAQILILSYSSHPSKQTIPQGFGLVYDPQNIEKVESKKSSAFIFSNPLNLNSKSETWNANFHDSQLRNHMR